MQQYEFIDVNYVNVNALYFYFTLILAEIDVKDIFYALPCSYPKRVAVLLVRRCASRLGISCNFHSPCSRVHLRLYEKFPSAHGCTYGYMRNFPLNSKL